MRRAPLDDQLYPLGGAVKRDVIGSAAAWRSYLSGEAINPVPKEESG